MRSIMISALLALSLFSCTPSFYNDLGRSRDNPQIASPRVLSFSDPGVIRISWDRDDCADQYILFRALDHDRNFIEVYRGPLLFYYDENVTAETRYLYSLYKVRGRKVFGPSSAVMGVGSSIREDPWENNDTWERAFPFVNDLFANTYGYKSVGHEYSILDRDFYYIEVRPHMTATYCVHVTGVSGSEPTGLEYQITYRQPVDVIDMGGISFENNESRTVGFVFSLSPKESDISQNVSEGGGRFFTYELRYIGETPAGG